MTTWSSTASNCVLTAMKKELDKLRLKDMYEECDKSTLSAGAVLPQPTVLQQADMGTDNMRTRRSDNYSKSLCWTMQYYYLATTTMTTWSSTASNGVLTAMKKELDKLRLKDMYEECDKSTLSQEQLRKVVKTDWVVGTDRIPLQPWKSVTGRTVQGRWCETGSHAFWDELSRFGVTAKPSLVFLAHFASAAQPREPAHAEACRGTRRSAGNFRLKQDACKQ